MQEKKLNDYIKKVDFSDLRVLIVGVVLLIIPVIVLIWLGVGGGNKKMSQERMRSMVNRKSIFNFGQESHKKKSMSSGSVKSGKKSVDGWFSSETPEKKVQRELEDALKSVQRSRRPERFPAGITEEQKQAYRAEHHPAITSGNGALEQGLLAEAEKFFAQALDEAKENPFLRVYALGGLIEVYERLGDKAKVEQAMKEFAKWVEKLPRHAGGGDMIAAMRNGILSMQRVRSEIDGGQHSTELSQVDLIRNGLMDQTKTRRGLAKSLAVFPVRLD